VLQPKNGQALPALFGKKLTFKTKLTRTRQHISRNHQNAASKEIPKSMKPHFFEKQTKQTFASGTNFRRAGTGHFFAPIASHGLLMAAHMDRMHLSHRIPWPAGVNECISATMFHGLLIWVDAC